MLIDQTAFLFNQFGQFTDNHTIIQFTNKIIRIQFLNIWWRKEEQKKFKIVCSSRLKYDSVRDRIKVTQLESNI